MIRFVGLRHDKKEPRPSVMQWRDADVLAELHALCPSESADPFNIPGAQQLDQEPFHQRRHLGFERSEGVGFARLAHLPYLVKKQCGPLLGKAVEIKRQASADLTAGFNNRGEFGDEHVLEAGFQRN